jgi:hypothetical protein
MLLGILLAICSSSTASAEERFALLIGNKNYGPLVQALINPHNDIDRIGKTLQQVGFSVVSKKDLGRTGMKREISEFVNRLSNAGPEAVGFLYYAGHGVTRPGYHKNYLIPIDIQDMQNPDLWWNAIALEEILDELERGAPNASTFVIFDACRNELRLPIRSPNKGFEAVVEKPGMFIAFSTSPNTSASDGGANGSPYAQALASELTRPGVHHLDLFQNVKERVFNATGRIQRPWEINGLFSRFYFAGDRTAPPQTVPATPLPLVSQPSVSQVASVTPPAGLPPPPSVTSATPSFNGTWFSSQYNFGFRIDGRIGRATKSNSPKFAPGDIILHIESLSENQFQGQQMYTDGNWYKVSGELLDAQTLKIRDNSSMHTMSRQAEREQPQIAPTIPRQAFPPVASATQLVNVSISIWEKTPGNTAMSAQLFVDGQRIGLIDNRERPMTLQIGQLPEGNHTLRLTDIMGYQVNTSLKVGPKFLNGHECSAQFIVSVQKPSLSLFSWNDGRVTTCGAN